MQTFYKILTYLLLPVAMFYGMLTLFSLMMGLSNISMLLATFLFGATVVYIFTSLTFMNRVIVQQGTCKLSLRDWIRVNGFVALFLSVYLLVQGVFVLNSPAMMETLHEQVLAMAAEMPASQPMANPLAIVKGVLWVMSAIGLMITVHVLIGFRYLRQYSNSFK